MAGSATYTEARWFEPPAAENIPALLPLIPPTFIGGPSSTDMTKMSFR
jgi:hypothetical protein